MVTNMDITEGLDNFLENVEAEKSYMEIKKISE